MSAAVTGSLPDLENETWLVSSTLGKSRGLRADETENKKRIHRKAMEEGTPLAMVRTKKEREREVADSGSEVKQEGLKNK